MVPPLSELELRRRIVKACRGLVEKGLVAAYDGNISARLPSGNLLVTPARVSKSEITEDSILYCSPEGRRIRGSGAVSTEVLLHIAAYRARKDVRGVVHAHPPLACAFTFSGTEALLAEPILPEVVARLGAIPTVPYETPGTQALADLAEPLLARHDAVLLRQHGAVTVAADPWHAFLLMEKVEHAAVVIKAARELAGTDAGLKRLTPEQTADLLKSYKYGKRGA